MLRWAIRIVMGLGLIGGFLSEAEIGEDNIGVLALIAVIFISTFFFGGGGSKDEPKLKSDGTIDKRFKP